MTRLSVKVARRFVCHTRADLPREDRQLQLGDNDSQRKGADREGRGFERDVRQSELASADGAAV